MGFVGDFAGCLPEAFREALGALCCFQARRGGNFRCPFFIQNPVGARYCHPMHHRCDLHSSHQFTELVNLPLFLESQNWREHLLEIHMLGILQPYRTHTLSHIVTRGTHTTHTSSTAQGGGGSFKNRKPIGKVGCCESGMAERIH